jgi:hypothetical protein
MPKFRFVRPETTRLSLSEGDWVEVKSRLTYAEQEALTAASLQTRMQASDLFNGNDGDVRIDWTKSRLARLNSYIAEWSFRDEEDKPVEVTPEAIEMLDPVTATEIHTALDKYLSERDAVKKVETGKPSPGAKSP